MAIKWNIKNLQVCGNSKLVMYQVNDDYATKYEKSHSLQENSR